MLRLRRGDVFARLSRFFDAVVEALFELVPDVLVWFWLGWTAYEPDAAGADKFFGFRAAA